MIATFEHYSSRLSAWHHGALVPRQVFNRRGKEMHA